MNYHLLIFFFGKYYHLRCGKTDPAASAEQIINPMTTNVPIT